MKYYQIIEVTPKNIHIIGIFYNLFKNFIGYKTLNIVRGGGRVSGRCGKSGAFCHPR